MFSARISVQSSSAMRGMAASSTLHALTEFSLNVLTASSTCTYNKDEYNKINLPDPTNVLWNSLRLIGHNLH